ncbi:probable carboxylesterase 6 [Cornus florida]|uniref:probable carboxylesterase 6 n=1 Tax=Cornus florida TaxID=4283 RepID=UPI00289FDFA7|nr:probable carboxylesterase 6 [Cornus florida]
MRKRIMATITIDPTLSSLQIKKDTHHQHGVVIEEIEGLIRVHQDGHVERPQIVPCVSCALPSELGVTSRDMVINKCTNIWARFYVPKCHNKQLPLLVYFHGGGFCVGSASWSCYHEFLARLAANAGCLIVSVNYRLAPENPLPAAYDDGFQALMWLKQQSLCGNNEWWSRQCNFSSIFLAGDSAGANIAHNVALRLCSSSGFEAMDLKPLGFKGTILIQPFFGGEVRTNSEKYMVQPPRSALSLAASDAYWRMSLPASASRDHPCCNPVAKGLTKLEDLRLLPTLVCVSELDILKDRDLEFCAALASAGKKVEHVVYNGVGHAFQILNKSQLSQTRAHEMISRIKAFINS